MKKQNQSKKKNQIKTDKKPTQVDLDLCGGFERKKDKQVMCHSM